MDYDSVLRDANERMDKALGVFKDKLRGMRTGRASPALVEEIRVEYYGSPTPLKQLASITAPEPDQLVIKPFDSNALGDVEKALLKSDLGITPTNDGKIVRLQIPPLSQERRQQLATGAKKEAEEARVAVRNIRRDANKSAEKLEKDGELSEDELKGLKDEIQKNLKDHEGRIDELLGKKVDELMAM